MDLVKDIKLTNGATPNEIIKQMGEAGGFQATHLAKALDILEKTTKDKDCFKFLSFPADIIATGIRGLIVELVKNKWVDCIITTCGTLDHDLARTWGEYKSGSFVLDDKELHKQGLNRLGNVLIPNEAYGPLLEEKMKPILEKLYVEKKEWSTKDLIATFGKHVENEESIIYWCHKNNIPIIVPGITDGAFGYQLWFFSQEHKDFKINLFEDESYLNDIAFEKKTTSALILGGGISKHHVIWWNQFKGGLDNAVYITTATEYDGSLSGAQTREAISWGKIKEDAKEVTVNGELTLILPFLIAALKERLL